MTTENDYKKLFEFSADLNQAYVQSSNNVEFRLKCLKLLQKYFGYQHLSLVLFEKSIKTGKEFQIDYDNVILGIPKEFMVELYSKYRNVDLNDIYGDKLDVRIIFRVGDDISFSEFERTDYYQNLLKKHGFYYQVVMSVLRDQESIGTLSITRSKPEGNFSDGEMQYFYPLRDLISRCLVNFLQLEILQKENLALKAYTNTFPIGHLIIDDKYKISYANPTGAEYMANIAGMPLDQFKFFFINKILPQIENQAFTGQANILIELPNYYLHINREHITQPAAWNARQEGTSIFIQKKIVASMPASLDTPTVKEFTTREIEIIELIRQGLKDAEIAKTLDLSVHTVKAHIRRIYDKVDVSNRTALLYKLTEIIS